MPEFIFWILLQRDAAVWATNTRLQVVGWTPFLCNNFKRMGQLLYYVSASLVWSQRTLSALFSSCGCKRLVPVTTAWTAVSLPPESLTVQLHPSCVVWFPIQSLPLCSPDKCTDIVFLTPAYCLNAYLFLYPGFGSLCSLQHGFYELNVIPDIGGEPKQQMLFSVFFELMYYIAHLINTRLVYFISLFWDVLLTHISSFVYLNL